MKHLIMPALFALALAACGQTEEPAVPAPEVEETVAATPPAAEPVVEEAADGSNALLEGDYCYLMESDSSTEGLQITVGIAGVYSGRHYGTIHDDENAYFAAFETMLSNGLRGEDGIVNFDAVTEVDGDTQYDEEPWVIGEDSAQSAHWDDAILARADCDIVDLTVWPPVEE